MDEGEVVARCIQGGAYLAVDWVKAEKNDA
jgi:hypothetical protein